MDIGIGIACNKTTIITFNRVLRSDCVIFFKHAYNLVVQPNKIEVFLAIFRDQLSHRQCLVNSPKCLDIATLGCY